MNNFGHNKTKHIGTIILLVIGPVSFSLYWLCILGWRRFRRTETL